MVDERNEALGPSLRPVPHQPYIAINDLPKIQALKEFFPDSYREIPVLVAGVPSAK